MKKIFLVVLLLTSCTTATITNNPSINVTRTDINKFTSAYAFEVLVIDGRKIPCIILNSSHALTCDWNHE